MNNIKKNKITSLLILLQLITIFTLIVSAYGESSNNKKQMENKSKLSAIAYESGQTDNASSFDTITLGGGASGVWKQFMKCLTEL